MSSGCIRVGIGGWSYEPWRQTFYPSDLPKSKELSYASRQVSTIEINATYYRTQSPQTFRRWAAETPDDFVFAVKANRFACNRKDLAEDSGSVRHFIESGITELGPKLGPLLWQLAPTKKFNPAEIAGFLDRLPREHGGLRLRHVLEVRHASFRTPEFVALARRHGVAICLAISDDYPLIADPTADFCYLRLQTTTADHTTGYDAAKIKTLGETLRRLATGAPVADLPSIAEMPDPAARDCFVYLISGAKELNPAAAKAILVELGGQN